MSHTTKAEKAARAAKMEAIYAEAKRIVATGICPHCAAPLRRNLSMTGWWQCGQYGSDGFRKDNSKPACPVAFQTFTE